MEFVLLSNGAAEADVTSSHRWRSTWLRFRHLGCFHVFSSGGGGEGPVKGEGGVNALLGSRDPPWNS